MINKKAAIFHWIIFAIIGCLGVVAYVTIDMSMNLEKGDYEFNLLYFHEEVKEAQLYFDQVVRSTSWQTVIELSENGFLDTNSNCGNIDNYNYWYFNGQNCFPDYENIFLNEFDNNLKTSFTNYLQNVPKFHYRDYKYENYLGDQVEKHVKIAIPEVDYEYLLDGPEFKGKSDNLFRFVEGNGDIEYSITSSFTLDITYNLMSDFYQLNNDVNNLLSLCLSDQNLESCIDNNMLAYWHFTDCNNDNYLEFDRSVKFCVESPNDYSLYNLSAELIPINYKFALDFSPSKPFSVTELYSDSDSSTDYFLIYFELNEFAEKYNIYLTDNNNAGTYSGSVDEFENYYLYSTNYYDVKDFYNYEIESDCPSDFEAGEIYTCDGALPGISYGVYVLDSNELDLSSENYFAVTVSSNNQESDIISFNLLN
ncbi:hypothetical protein HN385_06935 [archaeon]|jgi:hypothetical protein|nr:hypothetical protein [archaeon]MBT3451008.1 hypothetical protein [archaeon]MBT6868572.1 hypothetical protein [archaeon]MBT7193104.1 hypothetical protein [archaeon]MBT7380421.1 hypothetical protein [archaeon]